jgi:hypothetical protein
MTGQSEQLYSVSQWQICTVVRTTSEMSGFWLRFWKLENQQKLEPAEILFKYITGAMKHRP